MIRYASYTRGYRTPHGSSDHMVPSDAHRHRARPVPAPVTAERLHAAALRHLARYAVSTATLHRVLMRRVQRSARLHETDPAEGARMVEAELVRLTVAGQIGRAHV